MRSGPVTIFTPPTEGQQAQDTRHIVWAGRELDVYKAPVITGGFLIGVVDVTARMQAESMVRQSQKMEAIGHLTGGVAHDFNNLLQIISANLDLVAASSTVLADPRLRERLQNAIGAVSRGSRLTGQLLAFARRQALAPRSVDLGRVIRDMSDMLRRTLGDNILVETVIAGGLWNTLVDPSQVENTVLNLAINARDAMPEGGRLTLEVANAYLDDAYAALHAEVTAGQYVMLAVSDTGTGMTPEVIGRVFEPFFTHQGGRQGHGAGPRPGLWLHQAERRPHQDLQRGRRRHDHQALSAAHPGAPPTRWTRPPRFPPKAAPSASWWWKTMKGCAPRSWICWRPLGYQVSRAENAEAALALLEKEAPDLIFTDVVMPGAVSTRDFTARAQAMHPGIRILYTSGYTQNAIVHNGKLDDDALLLSKPYRKDELARKLRSVFAGTARGAIAPPQPAPQAGPASHRGKVLVVEDIALIRLTTVDMLEQLGFATAEAGDGAEALAILQQDTQIDVLLTDLGLPGMNGRQLMEEALRLKPSLRVIIASGLLHPAG